MLLNRKAYDYCQVHANKRERNNRMTVSNDAKRTIPAELVIEGAILQELCLQSPHKAIALLLFNLSTYVLLGLVGLWLNVWWLWPVVWWFQGMILYGFACAAHDCIHGVMGNSERTNRLAGIFFSVPIWFNFTLYKYFHFDHHKYTNVSGDSQEIVVIYSTLWDYASGFIIWVSAGATYWLIASVQACFGKFPSYIRSEKARRAVLVDSIVLFLWILLMTAVTCWWTEYALLFYWCPLIAGFVLVYLMAFPEHYGCTQSLDPSCNTRSIYSNFLVRWINWYGNYHAEHHLYPAVPSYNLPRVRALIGKGFKFQECSYILFHLKLIGSLLPNQR